MEHDKHPLCSWTQTDRNNRSIFSLTLTSSSILWHNKTNKQLKIINLKEKKSKFDYYIVFCVSFISSCWFVFHTFISFFFFFNFESDKMHSTTRGSLREVEGNKKLFLLFSKKPKHNGHITKLALSNYIVWKEIIKRMVVVGEQYKRTHRHHMADQKKKIEKQKHTHSKFQHSKLITIQ